MLRDRGQSNSPLWPFSPALLATCPPHQPILAAGHLCGPLPCALDYPWYLVGLGFLCVHSWAEALTSFSVLTGLQAPPSLPRLQPEPGCFRYPRGSPSPEAHSGDSVPTLPAAACPSSLTSSGAPPETEPQLQLQQRIPGIRMSPDSEADSCPSPGLANSCSAPAPHPPRSLPQSPQLGLG